MSSIPNQLFELISAMDGNEKRYFHLYAKLQKGDAVNEKLFDAIASLKKNDDTLLLKKLNGLIDKKNLSYQKHYLYNLILKSLSNYHADDDIESKMIAMIGSAHILFRKGLFQQSLKILDKAEETAKENELIVQQLEVMQFRSRFATITDNVAIDEGSNESALIRSIDLHSRIKSIRNDLYNIFFKEGFPSTQRSKDNLERIYAQMKDIKEDDPALTSTSKYLYVDVNAYYFLLCRDFKRLHGCRLKQVEVIKNSPLFMKNKPEAVVNTYYNALTSATHSHFFDDFEQLMKEYVDLVGKKMIKMPVSLEERYRYIRYYTLITNYILKCEFEKVFVLEKEIKTWMDKVGAGNQIVLVLKYNLMLIHFYAGEFKEALQISNELLNNELKKNREDLYNISRFVHLFVHYELKNFDLVWHSAKSMSSLFKTKEMNGKLEKCILKYMQKELMFVLNKEKRKIILTDFRNEVSAIMKNDPAEENKLAEFDILAWLDSLIQERKIVELLKEKHLKN